MTFRQLSHVGACALSIFFRKLEESAHRMESEPQLARLADEDQPPNVSGSIEAIAVDAPRSRARAGRLGIGDFPPSIERSASAQNCRKAVLQSGSTGRPGPLKCRQLWFAGTLAPRILGCLLLAEFSKGPLGVSSLASS